MSPRPLEELFSLALDAHDEACLRVDRTLLSGPHWKDVVKFRAAMRAARGEERRWRRVLVTLAEALSLRVPHQVAS